MFFRYSKMEAGPCNLKTCKFEFWKFKIMNTYNLKFWNYEIWMFEHLKLWTLNILNFEILKFEILRFWNFEICSSCFVHWSAGLSYVVEMCVPGAHRRVYCVQGQNVSVHRGRSWPVMVQACLAGLSWWASCPSGTRPVSNRTSESRFAFFLLFLS